MIVRTWHGIVPQKEAVGFQNYLAETGIKEAKLIDGNRGAFIYHQLQGEFEHFFMVSYWESVDSIKQFAGDEPHIAVTYPEDNEYHLISDPIVLHHEIDKLPTEFPLFL